MLVGAALAAMAFTGAAKADMTKTWDFTGTVNNTVGPKLPVTVTGTFTLDETTAAVTAFDFTDGNGSAIAPSATADENFRASVITSIAGETELEFQNLNGPNRDSLILFFDDPILSFNGADFLAGGPAVPNSDSRINCIDAASFGCGTIGVSGAFTSGSAVPAAEPLTLALFGAGLAMMAGIVKRRRRLAAAV